MSIRATGSLKQRLVAAAAKNDQSLSQEAENRLEKSFYGEGERALTLETLRTPQLAGLVSLLFLVMKRAVEESHLHSILPESGGGIRTVDWHAMDWLSDPYAFDQMSQAALATLEMFRPAGDVERFSNGTKPEGNFFRWYGTALAYGIVKELVSTKDDGRQDDLLIALRHDLDRHLKAVTLPASAYDLIEKLKARADAIVAAAATVRRDPGETDQQTDADRGLIEAARKRAASKRKAADK